MKDLLQIKNDWIAAVCCILAQNLIVYVQLVRCYATFGIHLARILINSKAFVYKSLQNNKTKSNKCIITNANYKNYYISLHKNV